MTNMQTEVKGDKLVITVDLGQSHGSSKSGKTEIVASSHGAVQVPHKDQIFSVNLNVYKAKK